MIITLGNHKSSEDNLEGQRWIVRYIENKIGKTQATLLTFIFLIPGSTTFTNFSQVSSSIYAALFGTTHDPSCNPYIVTKLVPLSLWCTFPPLPEVSLDHSHLLYSQPEELLLKTLSHCNFFHSGVCLCAQEPLAHPHYKGSRFHLN